MSPAHLQCPICTCSAQLYDVEVSLIYSVAESYGRRGRHDEWRVN